MLGGGPWREQPMIVRYCRPIEWTAAVDQLVYAGYTIVSCWEGQGELRAYVLRPPGTELPNGWQEM